jgi:hypothetical protein
VALLKLVGEQSASKATGMTARLHKDTYTEAVLSSGIKKSVWYDLKKFSGLL